MFLEKPPPSKRTSPAHVRHNSSGSRAFLSVLDNTHGAKGSGVRSLPSSPLLRPTTGSSTPKYLPIGGSPRIAPSSSPRLPPASPKTTPPLRIRLIHMLALGPLAEQDLLQRTRAVRTELTTCLQDIARKTSPGSSSWELKDESYRDLKPKEWRNYTSKEREIVEKKQMEVIARLRLPSEPEPKIPSQSSEIPKKRSASDASETSRSVATTPRPVDSPVKTQSTPSNIPIKRPAEDDAANPVRKLGGGIISTKNKSTKVTPKDTSSQKETVSSKPTQARTTPPKKTKENPKIKSAEKILDSDSDSDVPLEKQVKSSISREPSKKTQPASSGFKDLGSRAIESNHKRESQIISPPVLNTYRSRTSSTSSSNSYSPPKKRSPLATNEPVTAVRGRSPPGISLPSGAKKRAREDEISMKQDKRQKLQVAQKDSPKTPSTKQKQGLDGPIEMGPDSKKNKISQEHHDLAERFRKLYPEYQQLHRRLQRLDTDRLAKEKSSIDRLHRLQEQLEKWKATLWRVAGETRLIGTERTSGMVGVRV